MRYFADRQQAGKLLADQLIKHSKENCVVVSLNEGGVVIGLEIAKRLHTALFLLVMEDVELPGEPKPIATMSMAGTFTYNNEYSPGELEELTTDYRSIIEEKRILAFHKLNRIGDEGIEIPKSLLKNHTVILVSDGLRNGLSIDVAADFLKPILTRSIIIAAPIASVPAMDRMHLLGDEVYCLNIVDQYMGTNHYYQGNTLPKHEEIVDAMKNIILSW